MGSELPFAAGRSKVRCGPIVTDAAPCTFRHEGRILLKNSGVGRSGQIQQNSILVISNLTYFSWHILAIGEQFSAF
jgi:hypothetical protein